MTQRNRGIALVVIQLLLISSVAGKYLYERVSRPRVWARAAQYDPETPMRGRYLALSPEVDVCSLLRNPAGFSEGANNHQHGVNHRNRVWPVRVVARNGHLATEDAREVLPRSVSQTAWLEDGSSCDRAHINPGVDFFIPDTARSPFPLKQGQELWVEVTVPSAGPPRPIQLAVSENGSWKPLHFE